MPIQFTCACGKSLTAKEGLAGKMVKCPSCGKPVRVRQPNGGSTPAPARTTSDSGQGREISSPKKRKAKRELRAESRRKQKRLILLACGGGVTFVGILVGVILLASGKKDRPEPPPAEPSKELANATPANVSIPDTPALNSPDPEVRAKEARALVAAARPSDPTLSAALKHATREVRYQAALTIVTAPTASPEARKAIVPVLREAIEDKETLFAYEFESGGLAFEGTVQGEKVKGVFGAGKKILTQPARAAALEQLANLAAGNLADRAEAVQVLVRALPEDNAFFAACAGLRRLGTNAHSATPELLKMLKDAQKPGHDHALLNALVAIDATCVVSPTLPDKPGLKEKAEQTIRFFSTQAVASVRTKLKDPDPKNRDAAIKVLQVAGVDPKSLK